MKILSIFTISLLLSVAGIAQRITLHEKNVPLQNVLKEIEKQSGYQFFYKDIMEKQFKNVTVDLSEASLETALKAVFNNQLFTYDIVNKTIVIREKQKETAAGSNIAVLDVRGTVRNENGNPVAGVSVKLEGATRGTTATDEQGNFVFHNADSKGTLTFSGTNIEKTFLNINGNSVLPVVVVTKINKLQEIVINKGYYTEREKTNTGNVYTVKAAEIRQTAVTNPILALEGRVPGLFMTPASGLPGAKTEVLIRGRSSFINRNDPLYIIDGVPFNPNNMTVFQYEPAATPNGISPLSTLNPANIEEITILKDADATAIYGSRGGNGVILITTKKGKAGRTTFDVDLSSGFQKYPGELKMLNTEQYVEMRKEAFENDGRTPGTSDYDINGTWEQQRYTNWQKALLGGTAHINNAQLRIGGGNENTRFTMAGGYRKQSLVFSTSQQNDQQGSFDASIVHTSPNKKFDLTLSAGYMNDVNKLPRTDITNSIKLAPNAPALYNEDGSLNWENNTFSNPYADMLKTSRTTQSTLTDNLMMRYHIASGLNIKVSAGYNTVNVTEVKLTPGTAINPSSLASNSEQRNTSYGQSSTKSWITEPQIEYTHRLGEGNLNVLVGSTFQQTLQQASGLDAYGFSSDAQLENYSSAPSVQYRTQQYSDYRYTAAYGRINYNLKDKYIVNFTGRRDGSSRFGSGKQFGNFGAVGLAWIFSDEPWFENSSWLSFGKLRGSYGITGNDQTTDYQYMATYSAMYYSYGGLVGIQPNSLSNPQLGWESNRKLEIGAQLGAFNDRVNLNISFFRNRSDNQLVQYILPSTTGFYSVYANLEALIQNSGMEAVVNTTNINKSHFRWQTTFNLTVPRNKWVSFPNLSETPYQGSVYIGKPLSQLPQYHSTGVDPVTGILTFEDLNKDGLINAEDYVANTRVAQNYYGGITNGLNYRGLQLDIFFQFVKQTGKAFQTAFVMPGSGMSNQPVTVLNRWQKDGNVTDIQKYSVGGFGSAANNAYNNYILRGDNSIVDASYIRLKSISLSYTLPDRWKKYLHVQQLQIYGMANNLFTITGYAGPDPSAQGNVVPQLRTIVGGIRVSL